MIYIKYLKATGEILSYGTDVRAEDHPTEATIPMVEGFDLKEFTHVKNGKLAIDAGIVRERKLVLVRAARDRLLDKTDLTYCNAERWAALTLSEQRAWRDYKQALRDFPETCDPANPVWPIPPNKRS